MASRFGDYRCEGSELVTAQTVIYSGGIVGLVLTIFLSSRLTYRWILLIGVGLTLLSLLVVLLSSTLTAATVALFIAFGMRCVMNEICYVYISELVGE